MSTWSDFDSCIFKIVCILYTKHFVFSASDILKYINSLYTLFGDEKRNNTRNETIRFKVLDHHIHEMFSEIGVVCVLFLLYIHPFPYIKTVLVITLFPLSRDRSRICLWWLSVLKAIHYNHTHRLDMNEILLKRTFNSILLHPVFLRFFSAMFCIPCVHS